MLKFLILNKIITKFYKDSDTIEIFTEIRKKSEKENSNTLFGKSNLVNESIRSYLENITNASVKSILAENNYKASLSDDQDDDTSIQETITFKSGNRLGK